MSEEQEKASGQNAKKGLRLTPVLAAALAAVTAALLGSTLGVAGTVVGAGVASIVTTVGGELYLRSLQRTRDAALKARSVLATAGQRRGTSGGLEPVEDPAQLPTMYLSTRIPADPSEMPTVRLSKPTGPENTSAGETEPEPAGSLADKLRKLRWPLIIGTSVVATAIAIVFMLGLEGATNGKAGAGFYHKPDTSQQQNREDTTPTTSQNTAPPTETSSGTPTSSEQPPTSSTTSISPTTDSNPPSTSAPSTGTSQPPTQQSQPTKAGAPTNANS
ncbi:hypothetical protein [Amycolatopsis saalfeldensis]|uniref:Uncharacterized protein n=1 Tax=Amycolatopsis saalfeldensis TaxID=394193 RepID=A0A1H8WHU3_9PSEU|nr:hypothetical protein [Amycolatopsis saalfeldensis]SEP26668.1 hypothetical protein SAMN04489732_105163 [Amycolatopsis saalfeldensis]